MNRSSSFKEASPSRSKSRNEKFHKLFKSVPEEEYPVDYFSCAFIGDILLQGNLYISRNWFCFYSKIRGRGRLLQIPMEKVISITREKTALIIPNAIGLQTAEQKYVFGSFLTRDSTYRFLCSMWKQSQLMQQNSSSLNMHQDDSTVSSNGSSRLPPPASTGDLQKTKIFVSDNQNNLDIEINNDYSVNTHSETNCVPNSSDSDPGVCLQFGNVNSIETTENKSVKPNVLTVKSQTYIRDDKKHWTVIRGFNIPYFLHCFDYHKMYAAFSELSIKFQKIPRTNLLLAICSLMVMFLLLSAVGLTYKILLLQARLEARDIWLPVSKDDLRTSMYHNYYNLQANTHLASVRQLHDVLQANLEVLDQDFSRELASLSWTLNNNNTNKQKVSSPSSKIHLSIKVSGNLRNLQGWTSESGECKGGTCS